MRGLIAAVAMALGLSTAGQAQDPGSHLTLLEVDKVTPDKTYDGVAYVKISGVAHGVIAPSEAVVGLDALPKNAAGLYEYASGFEIIAPAEGQPTNDVAYLDTENRGSAVSQGALGGFLQTHKTTYARIQWQTGISKGVPANAQGVGLVILRDFGRYLKASATRPPLATGGFVPPPHQKLIIGGISQSAWTVNTLIAEGFNVDPATKKGVFDAAIAVDGVGSWLAINQIAKARNVAQTPYVEPNGPPLGRTELLKRPQSDPLYVDIANYTDFYRLRAGLTSISVSNAKFRRYDFPSPHAVGSAQAIGRCTKDPITPNTLRYAPYMRAIVLGMEKAIGVPAAKDGPTLPRSTVFQKGAAPPPSETFNPLPGRTLTVPIVDQYAWPVGGVRFPEADNPLGRPVPVAVPPVITTSISGTCGNFGGFQPYDSGQLTKMYGGKAAWLKRYETSVDKLIKQGFLLAEDKAGMLREAGRQWP